MDIKMLEQKKGIFRITTLFGMISFLLLSASPMVAVADVQITNVETMELVSTDLEKFGSYVGHLAPNERVVVSSEVSGLVEKMNLTVGQKVKKGKLLAKIDTARMELNNDLNRSNYELAALEYRRERSLFDKDLGTLTSELILRKDLARSNYELALEDYQREVVLFKKNLSTEAKVSGLKNKVEVNRLQMELAELELKKAETKQAKGKQFIGDGEYVHQKKKALASLRNQMEVRRAQYFLSQLDLKKSKILSPINGVIVKTFTEQGEFLGNGGQVAEIIDVSKVLAKVNIPEREIAVARKGKKVLITLDALPGETFTGVIKTRGVEANLNNRSFPIEIEIKNAKGKLLPGMLVRMKMRTFHLKDQIVIPRHTIQEDENGSFVFISQEGKAVRRVVKTGIALDQEIQILSGLKAGDRLIVVGHQLITANETVNIAKVMTQER